MARTFDIAPNRHAAHPFDLKHGTDTAGYLRPEQVRGGGVHDAMNNGYSAIAPSVFREAIRRWRESLPRSAARVDAYTFVDVGAGKGRALLLAAEMPFRKVIGVEVNEELARCARQNITRLNRKSQPKIRVLHQDAIQFRWPRPPLLVFLNNPFDCPLVERLAAKLAALVASSPGLVDLLYVNPGCSETLLRTGAGSTWSPRKGRFFKLLWTADIPMDEEDQRADPYGAASDRVAAFRCCAGLRPLIS